MSITNAAVPNSATAAGNIYVSSGNTVISTMHLCNFSSTAQTVNVHIVPAGSIANSTNIIYSNVSISAYNTLVIDKEKFVLSNNDTIRANCNTAGTVSATITYAGM